MKAFFVPMLLGICLISSCTGSMPGTAPGVMLSATTVMFGQEIVGTSGAMQSVTLSNNGTGTLQISSIAASTNFQETNTCGTSLGPAMNCTINITFAPGAAGNLTGKITVTDNATGSPHVVMLTGTGSVSGPRCTTKGMQCPPQFPRCCPGLMCVPASTRAFCE